MDRSAGPARLPGLDGVVLVQTDTTVGFVSRDAHRLARSKTRPSAKPFLKTYASLKAYKAFGRIPERFKRELRRSSQTTYIVKNSAFRIVPDGPYHAFLKPYGWLYSTSANASGARYDAAYALAHADAVIEDPRGLFEDVPSRIYKINQCTKRRIR